MADELDDLPDGETRTPLPVAKKPAPKPIPAPREEPDEDEEEPVAKKHRHTPGMVNLARHFGYSESDLDDTSPADLRNELSLLQTEVGRRTPKPTAEAEKKAAPVDEDEAYLDSLEKNPDIDKEHVKFLRKLKAKADAADKKAAKVDEFDERDKKRETAKHVEMLDNSFTGLGKRFEKLVGTDGMAELNDPGMRGWRMEIVKHANIEAGDSQRTMNKKLLAAAEKVAVGRVEEDDTPDLENPYEASRPKKKVAKDAATGRFTEEDFARGHVAKPSVKKIAAGEITAVEATRNLLRQNGDPRGFRPAVSMDDDDLPG